MVFVDVMKQERATSDIIYQNLWLTREKNGLGEIFPGKPYWVLY